MVEYFNAIPHTFWFVVGFVLLAIEGLVLGLTTGVLLAAGVGALITGALMYFESVPTGWASGIATFTISSALATVALWKPLKRLQRDNTGHVDKSSDLIGHTFRLASELTSTKPTTTRYSGVEWRVELDESSNASTIGSGEMVEVRGVSAGVFRVAKP